jgi:hypothetical protein
MISQKVLLGFMLFAMASLIALVLYNMCNNIKYRNDKEMKDVMIKAKAVSAWTLFGYGPLVTVVTFFTGENVVFTPFRVRIVLMFALGVQCLVELFAAIYFKAELEKSRIKVVD